MPLDDEIKKKEREHKELIESMFNTESELERLYVERSITSELFEKLAKEQIDVQVAVRDQGHEVHLKKGDSFAVCATRSLSSALLGALIALKGEMTHAI
jgi:regulator of RNase E activity RraB